jgi:hypothetical protein
MERQLYLGQQKIRFNHEATVCQKKIHLAHRSPTRPHVPPESPKGPLAKRACRKHLLEEWHTFFRNVRSAQFR